MTKMKMDPIKSVSSKEYISTFNSTFNRVRQQSNWQRYMVVDHALIGSA